MSDTPDPQQFLEQQLPAQFNATLAEQQTAAETAQRVLEGMRAVSATIGFELTGEGGGGHYVNFEAGRATASDEPAQLPFLTLAFDRADFGALYAEMGNNVLGFLGGVSGMGAELKLTSARLDLLSNVKGTLAFELTGEGGFRLLARLGGASGEPDTTIRVDRQAYRDLREGRTEPQQAFLDGQIQVDGDMQLAMSLALAVLSPD